MDAQLQQKAVQVAGRLSGVARATSRRVLAVQMADLAERAEREAKEVRLFKNRLSRAKSGLRRILAFASSRPIQQLTKTNARLKGSLGLLFYESRWDVVGTRPVSFISFSIDVCGVRITMTNYCHVIDKVVATFPCKGSEGAVIEEFGGRKSGEWSASPEEILSQMADGTMSSFNQTSEENEAAFKLLASWARSTTFERDATHFLEELERQAV